MSIRTEPISRIPRPLQLIEAVSHGNITDPRMRFLYDEAFRHTEGSLTENQLCYTRAANMPVQQAGIAPSALSLMHSAGDIQGRSRDRCVHDPLRELAADSPGIG